MIIFLKCLQFIFSIIFKLPANTAIMCMHLAGDFAFLLVWRTKIRKTVIKNYQEFFPKSSCALLAEKLLRNACYSVFELICLPFFKDDHIASLTKISGLENIDLVLSKRKGGFFLSMHTGNYELMSPIVSRLGYPVTEIVKSPDNAVFKFIDSIRASHGTKLINVLREDMFKETMKDLRSNRIVGILIDTGANESRNEIIEFLGKKMPAAIGWTLLARRTEAEIVLAISKREGKKIAIDFSPPFAFSQENKAETLEKIRKHFEDFLKTHPEQWYLFLNKDEISGIMDING